MKQKPFRASRGGYATVAILVLCVLVVGLLWLVLRDKESSGRITSFEECVEAGYPILDSYPEQCETPDGRTFVRDGSDELPGEVAEHINAKRDLIVVEEPFPQATVMSPLRVRGQARGTWYFEGSFPIKILDANGEMLGVHYATAQGEWMTENFVPFDAELTFTAPTTRTGTLVLEKDNPSGLAEHADELRIPVTFELAPVSERTVQLYYYNPDEDTDSSGNVMCSREGLVSVERVIPVTQTPVQDTIKLLLKGELTAQEASRGITTEYPLNGLTLEGASLANGVLTLGFNDPNNATSGGSCRVGILWFQIRETALQFEGVNEVRFQPEELFQP